MMSVKMAKALNEQFNFEIYSSYIYASMSSWFKARNLNGFANWMNVQVREELDHAARFYSFMHDYGASVEYDAIPKPKSSWKTPTEIFGDALHHEGLVTSRINKLIDLALKEKDHATYASLQWFISEQVEEEANASAVLQQLKMIKDAPDAIMFLDRELGQRVYTPPAGADGQ